MILRRFTRISVTLSAIAFTFAALATGCADDEAIVGGSCASGYVQCGDRCVDLTSDPNHCGACESVCPVASACVAGVCGGLPLDGSSVDGSGPDGSSDATLDSAGDVGRGEGGFASDGANESAAGDGVLSDGSNAGDGSEFDATLNDGASAEGSEASDAAPDGTTSEAEAPDASTIDAENGDGCPPGVYDTAQACGDCVTACTDATPVCTPEDGGFACAALCAGTLMNCGNQCVDLTRDSSNCGACGNVCASQICQSSQCVGATTGGVVFIGHDFATTTPGTTQARVLSNAVFIPQTNPLRVLSYERYADAGAVTRIMTILNGVAKELGRTLNITETKVDTDIPNTLSLQNFDVLLVPDQPSAPAGALAALGPPSGGNWAATLSSFAENGGVVVVLDGGSGVGEMPAFVSGTGLLTISAQAPLAAGTLVQDQARADVEGVGLVSPYATAGNSVSVTTEAPGGDVVYVVVVSSDAGASPPVVVHKVF